MRRTRNEANVPKPPHRAIIDRRTGQIVGPVVPISAEDWPFKELPFSEILWRYMDCWKFEDLLRKSALFFSRPDQFENDPMEGRLSTGNSDKTSPSDAAFYSAYKIQSSTKELEAAQEIMRKAFFISCWQRGTKESREMWLAYTSRPESVAITTSAKALYKFVRGNIIKSPVKYHSSDFPRTEFNHASLFFYKPSSYSFEQEFRLLLAPEEESVSLSELGRHVPICLKKIVHRVITHPNASKEFKRKVEDMVRAFVPLIRREDSALPPDRPPSGKSDTAT